MIINEIQESYIEKRNDGFAPLMWVLVNPKAEREFFLDKSLKKSDSIDDGVVIEVPTDKWTKKLKTVTLKTIITEKVERFLIL